MLNTNVGSLLRPYDPDRMGQPLSFSITGQPARFKIEAVRSKFAQIKVVKGARLDFEVENTFVVIVRCTDSGAPAPPALTARVDVTIKVIDVNERPEIDDAVLYVKENTPRDGNIGHELVGRDVDRADQKRLRYKLPRSERRFGVRSTQGIGQLIVAAEPMNYEFKKRYTTTVYVYDTAFTGGRPLEDSAAIVIHVVDVNERPNIEDAVRSVEENSWADRFIGVALPATDPDEKQTLTYEIVSGEGMAEVPALFKISACDGQLFVKTPCRRRLCTA